MKELTQDSEKLCGTLKKSSKKNPQMTMAKKNFWEWQGGGAPVSQKIGISKNWGVLFQNMYFCVCVQIFERLSQKLQEKIQFDYKYSWLFYQKCNVHRTTLFELLKRECILIMLHKKLSMSILNDSRGGGGGGGKICHTGEAAPKKIFFKINL